MRVMGKFALYFDPTGLAAARIDVRAFRVVMMPAFAIETVCCSCKEGSIHALDLQDRKYHDFVQHTARGVGHLVELIDTADTPVAQNKCTTG